MSLIVDNLVNPLLLFEREKIRVFFTKQYRIRLSHVAVDALCLMKLFDCLVLRLLSVLDPFLFLHAPADSEPFEHFCCDILKLRRNITIDNSRDRLAPERPRRHLQMCMDRLLVSMHDKPGERIIKPFRHIFTRLENEPVLLFDREIRHDFLSLTTERQDPVATQGSVRFERTFLARPALCNERTEPRLVLGLDQDRI